MAGVPGRGRASSLRGGLFRSVGLVGEAELRWPTFRPNKTTRPGSRLGRVRWLLGQDGIHTCSFHPGGSMTLPCTAALLGEGQLTASLSPSAGCLRSDQIV